MAHAPYDQLGTWSFDGDKNHTVTPLKALQSDEYKHIKYYYDARGWVFERREHP